MFRLVLLLFALFLLLTVLRGFRIFFRAVFGTPGGRGGRPPAPPKQGEMVRDPVCGTWIDRSLALKGQRAGQEIEVCSEECRRALGAAT